MSKIRGSYYVDGRRSLTLTTSDDDKLMDVGFRLVHDDEDRVSRGGSWINPTVVARVANRLGGSPGLRFGNLGFRLAFDREDT
jgi:hypothetical protein